MPSLLLEVLVMIVIKRKILSFFILFFLFFAQNSYSQDQNIIEILEVIQKDLKTLEKAVYSESGSTNQNTTNRLDQNTEDVLTRHLLKLSE